MASDAGDHHQASAAAAAQLLFVDPVEPAVEDGGGAGLREPDLPATPELHRVEVVGPDEAHPLAVGRDLRELLGLGGAGEGARHPRLRSDQEQVAARGDEKLVSRGDPGVGVEGEGLARDRVLHAVRAEQHLLLAGSGVESHEIDGTIRGCAPQEGQTLRIGVPGEALGQAAREGVLPWRLSRVSLPRWPWSGARQSRRGQGKSGQGDGEAAPGERHSRFLHRDCRGRRAAGARRATPAGGARSEESVDEGCYGRALREHDEQAKERQHQDDGPQPPLLPDAHERPDLGQEAQLLSGFFKCLDDSYFTTRHRGHEREVPPSLSECPFLCALCASCEFVSPARRACASPRPRAAGAGPSCRGDDAPARGDPCSCA